MDLERKTGKGSQLYLDLDDIFQYPDGVHPCYRLTFSVRNGDSGVRNSSCVTWKSSTSPHLGFDPENRLCVGYRFRRVFLSVFRWFDIAEKTPLKRASAEYSVQDESR